MRILYFIDSLKVGGAEVLLRNLATGVLAAGHEIHIGYCTPGPLENDFQRMGINLYRLPHRWRVDPRLLLRMYQLVRRLRPDVVHTHLFKSDLHGRLAGRMGNAGRVISTLHSTDPWAAKFPLGRIYGATARFADILIAVSDEVKAYHIRMTGVPPEKIISIANGIDIQRFAARPKVGSHFRAQYNIPRDALLLGAVGRLVPDKGHSDFLRAAALIAESHPRVWFMLVGDGPLRASLERQTEAAGIRPRVVFTGLIEEIPAAMQALDILVFSSLREGLPLTLLEGMAASKPVVATQVGGIGGVLKNGVSGRLVPAGDASALAHACLRLIEAPVQIAQMGKAAQQCVEVEYTLERMVAQTLQLYTKTL